MKREIVPRDKYRVLTVRMKEGAYLDALGKSTVQEIADAVGVRRETVSAWRGDLKYAAEVERWTSLEFEAIAGRMKLILTEHQDLLELLRTGLLEAIEAEKEEGVPNWGVRLEAYKIIAGHPATRRMFDVSDPAGPGNVNQTVTVHVHRTADGEKTVQIVEGVVEEAEFEEVKEDGNREGTGDDRGKTGATSTDDAGAGE